MKPNISHLDRDALFFAIGIICGGAIMFSLVWSSCALPAPSAANIIGAGNTTYPCVTVGEDGLCHASVDDTAAIKAAINAAVKTFGLSISMLPGAGSGWTVQVPSFEFDHMSMAACRQAADKVIEANPHVPLKAECIEEMR